MFERRALDRRRRLARVAHEADNLISAQHELFAVVISGDDPRGHGVLVGSAFALGALLLETQLGMRRVGAPLLRARRAFGGEAERSAWSALFLAQIAAATAAPAATS